METLQNKGWARLTATLMFQPSSHNEKQLTKVKKKTLALSRLKQAFSGRVETLVVVNPDKHVFEVLGAHS